MPDNPLAPVRGCLYGVVFGAALWLLIGIVVEIVRWIATR